MSDNESLKVSGPDAEEPAKRPPQEEVPGAARSTSPARQPKKQQFRRDKRDVHGWIILDKPVGMTSTQAVGAIKRLFSCKRAGHAGTLDPLASGLLPIALGEATKTAPYVMDGRKTYSFTVRWGEERDTDDADGRVSATSDVRPDRAAIEALLPRFTGEIEQIPPQFSAIKVDGERAYDLARDGEAVDLQARPVRDRPASPWWTCPTPKPPDSRPNAAKAPMSGHWPGIWAGPSIVTDISRLYGARRSADSAKPT